MIARLARVLAPAIALAGVSAAADAQVPTIDISPRAPSSSSASGSSGSSGAAAAPVVVPVGPDGQPQGPAPSGSAGWYYDDNADTGGEAGPMGDGNVDQRSGTVPELHVVRRGDTLWDLCWYYFNDPWQWPKIWSYNASITNPHWIYPGDLVRMVPKGMSITASAPSALPTDPEGSPSERPALGGEPAPARRFEVKLRQIAFVENEALQSAMRITGAVEEKALLSVGDSAYVSYPEGKPPKVGQRYSIYTVGNSVKGPKGGDTLGAYVRILGQIEIESVKRGKVARGIITESSTEIERGAHVGPLVVELKTVPPALPKVDAQGTIIALLEKDALIGSGEVVFVDLGEKSGLEVGNRMYVVRRGDGLDVDRKDMGAGQDDRRFPARALGEIVVVEVGRKVSIGLVTLAVQEMSVGDLVMMQKAP